MHVIVDCSSMEERIVPLSKDERARVEETRRAVAELDAAAEKAAEERKAALAVVQAKAAKDPGFAALAKLLSA